MPVSHYFAKSALKNKDVCMPASDVGLLPVVEPAVGPFPYLFTKALIDEA
jgi:hypothetical protein